MRNDWSCTKFADWLRGTPKPFSATSEGWSDWKKIAQKKRFRYWLAKDFLDFLQNVIYFPFDFVRNIHRYIDNRWIVKAHALTSTLKPGSWYDLDTRLLHAGFDELINFVEIELAWMQVISSEEDHKKYKRSCGRKFFGLGRWRSPESGIDYLNWASGLKKDENIVDKDSPQFGELSEQAISAHEIFLLYKWWKEDRPKRPDPGDASGWQAYCDEKRKSAQASGESVLSAFISNKDGNSDKLLNAYHQIEQEQDDEDTAMLIRLIKIRHSLWT